MPTTYTATRNASGKPPGGLRLPQRQQSTTSGSSIPVPSTSTVTENISSKKSLLPQRTVVPSRLPGFRRPQITTRPPKNTDTTQTQSTRNTEPVQEQQPEQTVEAQPIAIAPSDPPTPPPEPVQLEPEVVKLPPSEPATANTTTNTNRPPSQPRIEARTERTRQRSKSPVKALHNDIKPTATKKPSVPPAARPARSASLRQAPAPKPSGVGETRGHARHRSQVLGSQAIGAPPAPSAPSRERSGTGTGTTIRPRPQFTTYQQHFSPKKEAPRPAAAGDRRNTGKSAAGSELPPETVALQTEFLQLYLLHSSSIQQSTEWRSAVERQLREKYNEIAGSYRTILDEERRIQEELNLQALYDWSVESASLSDHNHGVGFQEEIQSFSRVTQEVADMTADGAGRYTLAVQVFEHWLDRVEYIQRIRGSQGDDDDDPQYIDSLGSVWRNEVDDLTIKAELCLRELSKMTIFVIDENEFCEKHNSSALVQIARKHRDVLVCMIEELRSMRAVESETVDLEQAWIARAADQIDVVVDQGTSIRTGIWRTMT